MKWKDMDFYDKLLFYWDKIEVHHYLFNQFLEEGNIKYAKRARELRDFFKAMLKKDLGVICHKVYE